MNITAKIIQQSISKYTGTIITTYELEYPRYIHSEFMTHRQFSRNAASSRAIPIDKMHEQILLHDVSFVHWGKNQPGMQSKEELTGIALRAVKDLWISARDKAIRYAKAMADTGAHKQLVNRVTEPYMMMKVVMTTTHTANWEWLRNHSDAQPEIQELARVMIEANKGIVPVELHDGEWHVPYVTRIVDIDNGKLRYFVGDAEVDVDTARKVSASCCAQVSYRKSDDSVEKAIQIYDRLINSEPVHASPIEHQATPINHDRMRHAWDTVPGITHLDRHGTLHSGNFHNWIQYRQLVPNNTKRDLR